MRSNRKAMLIATALIIASPPFASHNSDAVETKNKKQISRSVEGEVLSALHLALTKNDVSVCLNPMMAAFSVVDTDWADVRQELRDNGVKNPRAGQIKQYLVEDAQGYAWQGWGAFKDDKELAPEIAREIAVVHAGMAENVPKQRSGRRLRQGEVPAEISLREDCPAQLYAPAIRGEWAVVGRDGISAGFLYALHRVDGKWKVIAVRGTWLT